MGQVAIGTPTIFRVEGADSGGVGEVVGVDPWGDLADSTYASAWTRKDLTESFEQILASVAPTTLDPATLAVSLRMSCTADLSDPSMSVTAVINLYGPGSVRDGATPPLNLSDGSEPIHNGRVTMPTVDGTVYDIPVTFIDWNYEVPASSAQVADYFAGGGTILVQPTIRGAGTGTAHVKVHRLAFVADVVDEVAYRRIFPRDDRRNWPPSRAYSRGNRRGGGYL